VRTLLGTEGGNERVILCVNGGWYWGFYIAVRVLGRYYRFAAGPVVPYWAYVDRS
jgi:hypothetical protein